MHPLKNLALTYAHFLIKIAVKSCLNITVKGKENTPTVKSAIIVANHSSYIDVPVLGYALFSNLKNISWVISKYNYRLWFLKWVYVVFKVLVVNGTTEKIKKELKDNRWVAIFPQGGKRWCPPSKSCLKKPGTGAAAVALTMNVPIIPVGLIGTNKVLPARSFRLNPRRKITVCIGQPFSFETLPQEKINTFILKDATDEIMHRIRMAIEKYRRDSD